MRSFIQGLTPWGYVVLVIGVLLAIDMLRFGAMAPPPVPNGQYWFVLIGAVTAMTLWLSVTHRFKLLVGVASLVTAGTVLQPSPLVWPFAAAVVAQTVAVGVDRNRKQAAPRLKAGGAVSMHRKWLMTIGAAGFVAAGAWGYAAAYHVSIGAAAAQQSARQWIGPINNQSLTGGNWAITWVGYGGYLHRDWEVEELICAPGPSTCQASYAYTIFVNGQTGGVDRAMINTGPGVAGWPLSVVRTSHAAGGA